MAKSKKDATTDLGELVMGPAGEPVTLAQNGIQTDFGFYHSAGKAVPSYATEFAAGMDISANLIPGEKFVCYDHTNTKHERKVKEGPEGVGRMYIEPGDRVLVPTGLHADISEDCYLAIHARSGTSWKQGLILTNGVGVVDADYVEEIKVSLTNVSGSRVYIEDGERIAQLLLMPVMKPVNGFVTLNKKPAQKTSRAGGFGSTGAK